MILSRIFMDLFIMNYSFSFTEHPSVTLIIFMFLYFTMRISYFGMVTTFLMFVLRTSMLHAKYNDLSPVYLPLILSMCGIMNEKKTLLIMC